MGSVAGRNPASSPEGSSSFFGSELFVYGTHKSLESGTGEERGRELPGGTLNRFPTGLGSRQARKSSHYLYVI